MLNLPPKYHAENSREQYEHQLLEEELLYILRVVHKRMAVT